jgi:hypothetical protein
MKNIHIIPTDKPSRLVIDTIENKLYYQPILHNKTVNVLPQNIYITSDSEIKEGDWIIRNKKIVKAINTAYYSAKKIILTTDQDLIKDGVQAIDDEFLEWFVKNPMCEEAKIENHVVGTGFTHVGKTPSKQERLRGCYDNGEQIIGKWEDCYKYKIIIPQEEPKQETLEEAAEKHAKKQYGNSCGAREERKNCKEDFIEGAKWQAKKDTEIINSLNNTLNKIGQRNIDNLFEETPKYTKEDLKKAFNDGAAVKQWSDFGVEMKYENFDVWFEQFKKK